MGTHCSYPPMTLFLAHYEYGSQTPVPWCYENVILPPIDVTSPNVMLSPQCLPAFSLVWAGGRNTVLDRDPPSLFTNSSARFNKWVSKQHGTRNTEEHLYVGFWVRRWMNQLGIERLRRKLSNQSRKGWLERKYWVGRVCIKVLLSRQRGKLWRGRGK